MYEKMREAKIKITEVAMVGAISACAQLRDIRMSNTLTGHLEEGCCGKSFCYLLLLFCQFRSYKVGWVVKGEGRKKKVAGSITHANKN